MFFAKLEKITLFFPLKHCLKQIKHSDLISSGKKTDNNSLQDRYKNETSFFRYLVEWQIITVGIKSALVYLD